MIPLALVLVMGGGFGAARWYSPKWLRYVGARCFARADALEVYKSTYDKRVLYWLQSGSKETR